MIYTGTNDISAHRSIWSTHGYLRNRKQPQSHFSKRQVWRDHCCTKKGKIDTTKTLEDHIEDKSMWMRHNNHLSSPPSHLFKKCMLLGHGTKWGCQGLTVLLIIPMNQKHILFSSQRRKYKKYYSLSWYITSSLDISAAWLLTCVGSLINRSSLILLGGNNFIFIDYCISVIILCLLDALIWKQA